jgi:hypothetical protein
MLHIHKRALSAVAAGLLVAAGASAPKLALADSSAAASPSGGQTSGSSGGAMMKHGSAMSGATAKPVSPPGPDAVNGAGGTEPGPAPHVQGGANGGDSSGS